MPKRIADDVIAIAARLAEIEADRIREINTKPIDVCGQCAGKGTIQSGNETVKCPGCSEKKS